MAFSTKKMESAHDDRLEEEADKMARGLADMTDRGASMSSCQEEIPAALLFNKYVLNPAGEMQYDPRWVVGTPLRVAPMGGWSLSRRAMRNLCLHSSHIVGVDASGNADFSNEHLIAFAEVAPRCEAISCAHCPRITDSGIAQVAELAGDTLCELNVSGNIAVTDRSLYTLARKCKRLTVLNANKMPGITGRGVASVDHLT